MNAGKQTKGERTKSLILETAMTLFQEKGYDESTMRNIAERAGVALGNAYYYIPSKEHFIHAFYERLWNEQLLAYEGVLEAESTLKRRLLGVLVAELRIIEPHHRLCLALFKSAADPRSPVSPFSEESRPLRESCIDFYRRLVEGATETIPPELKRELPYLLWLFHMGVVLFWIYDRSFGSIRTQKLVLHSADLIGNLVTLMSVPVMSPIRQRILNLIAAVKTEFLDETLPPLNPSQS